MMEWAQELSDSLKDFQNRLLLEEVKHQYYESLFNKVDTAVWVADRNGRIEWSNQAAKTQLGHLTQLPDVLMNTSSAHDGAVVRLERNGELLEMAASRTLFATRQGEQQLISLKNIHSVLERNEMEAWQKLIRVLTHEIMNSITPIISLSETLSERTASAQSTPQDYALMLQAMQTIHRRSYGLLEFVENYRRLTRIPTPVRTHIAVAELFAGLKELFPEEGIRFEMPPVSISVCIDRTQIEQILINLLRNAQDACAAKTDTNICVRAASTIKSVTLSVSDNGGGILPDVVDKIFIPFFTTKPSGSGIGLSLCKQIMTLHEGSIHVQSQWEKGSCFVLTFPKTNA
jgi:signal transduction histidine kinase